MVCLRERSEGGLDLVQSLQVTLSTKLSGAHQLAREVVDTGKWTGARPATVIHSGPTKDLVMWR